jgi:hypothetical protein
MKKCNFEIAFWNLLVLRAGSYRRMNAMFENGACIKVIIFWDVIACSLVKEYQCISRTFCLLLQVKMNKDCGSSIVRS